METKELAEINNTKLPDEDLLQLADNIVKLIDERRNRVAKEINNALVNTYWNIGKYIVEYEQDGNSKAKYGTSLLSSLARILRSKVGRGFSRPNLNNMRKFYLLYPICQTPSDKLSWSHICELITIDDDLERSFYEKECIASGWDVRTLRRQMDSGLFLRLASSKDKDGILQLAREGVVVRQPKDAIKDTYTFEFLGIPKTQRYSEKDLQHKLLDNLQSFLLELGKGFAFIGREYPLTIGNRHYYVDLVFYHRILKCFVLIDLKKNSVKHQDIGQMNMYLGYFAKEENTHDDNK